MKPTQAEVHQGLTGARKVFRMRKLEDARNNSKAARLTSMETSRIYYDDAAYRAIRAKLGEAIRSQYELALPERLFVLLKELERHRDGKTDGDGG
jgi:hypothetical protein